MPSITFVVPGQPSATRGGVPAEPPTLKGTLKHSVRVAARRGGGADVRVTATPGEDVVVLHIENGPSLFLHPENARDLILAQKDAAASNRGTRTRSVADADEVQVPAQFQWRIVEQATATARNTTRGRLGDVLLKGVEVVSDAAKDFAADFIVGKAQSLAASGLVAGVDAQVDEGVYRLDAKALPTLKTNGERVTTFDASGEAVALLLVHGTFSTTSGTFSKLWTQHPELVERLFKYYGNRVFALDHRTLGVSPITNALTLVKAAPKHARLHVVTHSRGGLVGEVLAHACAPGAAGLDLFDTDEYRVHREELAELLAEARQRDVHLERLVRVACPARGTLLASKRLDAYVSILKWSLELSGIPVVPQIVDFLNGVAQYRADPAKIPGLAAQIPDNPLVRWLHDVNRPIGGDLRVVAGDLAGNSIVSWLKTMLADAFYWTDNDLVVQTRSMYGGTPRSTKSTFVLDRGAKVSHFAYFANTQTAGAVVEALTEAAPADFQTIGPRSYAGEDSSGLRARRDAGEQAAGPRPDLPAVIIVPGIFGSHLKDDEGRVWLNWDAPNPLQRLALRADVTVDGLVEDFYAGLSSFLSSTHEVIEFAYDWRQPITTSAKSLRDTLSTAIEDRKASRQPVRIVTHSSGGVVARALQLVDSKVWKRWLSHTEARFLMLGPPNAGFWLPMQVLTGDETLGGLLTFGSAPFRDQETRQILAEFPGLIELQAGMLNDRLLLSRESRWRELAYEDVRRVTESTTWHTDGLQRRTLEWGIPSQALLDGAVELHKPLDRQRNGVLGDVAGKIAVVVGRGVPTPLGYQTGPDGLQYSYADDGDAYVNLRSASLPGAGAWVVDAAHTKLAATPKAFDAYLELLQQGRTSQLSAPAVRRAGQDDGSVAILQRPARTPRSFVPLAANEQLLGAHPSDDEREIDPATLRVRVINGDLSFVREPLMLGHYRSSNLTRAGAEKVVNELIGGAMAVSLAKGQYPDPPESHQVFINTRAAADDPRQLPRPEAVIIVGLGEEGKLQPADLVRTVKRGVIAWAQRVSERQDAPATFDLAATLIGSGGIGMSAGQSAQLIVQGVCEANDILVSSFNSGRDGATNRSWPHVGHLSLIELYLDRATEGWRALQMTAEDTESEYDLEPVIVTAPGALPRPLESSYRGADYDFIRAATQNGPDGEGIAYTLDTKRARTETRAQGVQAALLGSLITEAADDRSQDLAVRRTLFRLLVPVDLEPFLSGDTEAQFEVDSGTAGIPWELIDDARSEDSAEVPWAIRTKLLRKLRTTDFRPLVVDANADASVLVVGEPECDPTFYPPLVGAQQEALAVRAALVGPGALSDDQVLALTSKGDGKPSGPNARTVVNALMQRDWRIVHIAGHGEPPELLGPEPVNPGDPPQRVGNPRGVVLSNKVYLGPREIRSMRTVPELVFVNCCYLAARDVRQLFTKEQVECEPRYRHDRPKFASGVADALIKEGVRCVIAAGWAVEDTQAMVFARTFYERLVAGVRFIDAVAAARIAAWRLGGNTWAAYQCYGDPDWVFRRGVGDGQGRTEPGPDPDAGIASSRGLVLTLRTIAVKCEFQKASKEAARQRIAQLERRFGARWGHLGVVAEAFGVAYAKAGDEQTALEWYTTAAGANDGGASIRALEQRANIQVRLAWKVVEKALRARDALARKRPTKREEVDAADATLRKAIAGAKPTIERGIKTLKKLVEIEPSMERASLLGSAYKRLALIGEAEGNASAEATAIKSMKRYYEQAETIGRDNRIDGFYYPALNRLSAEFALGTAAVELEPQAIEAIRADLDASVRENAEFWNVVSQTELRVYEALSRGDLAGDLPKIIAAYDDLHLRIQQDWMWSSVYDQATFVLPKYSRSASAEERSAATRLIEYLALLSGRSAG